MTARAQKAFEPMTQPSLVELVGADLRDAILSGRFRAGERVSDARVAAEMGISRAPVREAIRQLAARGLVKEEPRRGAFVARLTRTGAHNVYECRRALEGLAVRRIATDPELAEHVGRLQRLVDEMERASARKDLLGMADADHRFHQTLCELTGNAWLVRLYAQIADQNRLMQALDTAAHLDADQSELVMRHEPIVDAIATGDPDVAERETLAHIDLSEQLFLSRVPHGARECGRVGEEPDVTDSVAAGVRRAAPNDTIGSVQGAVRLLEAIAAAPSPPMAADLAKTVGLNVSTCYRLLNTLGVEALVVRDDDSRYHLGPKMPFLAGQRSDGAAGLTRLTGELEELNARSRETSYLVAWNGDRISVSAARLGHEPVVVGDIRLGFREHAHAKASGKAILAFFPKDAVDRYVRTHPLLALTPKTVVDPKALRTQLAEIRKQRFAEEIEEFALGVACLAAPILTASGRSVGALAVSVPLERYAGRRDTLVKEVIRAGVRASEVLGAQ